MRTDAIWRHEDHSAMSNIGTFKINSLIFPTRGRMLFYYYIA